VSKTDKAQDAPQDAPASKPSKPGAISARTLARIASGRLGRDVTDKRVRSVARDTLARFDKAEHPDYQAHAYTPAEAADLLAALASKGRGAGTMGESDAVAAIEAAIAAETGGQS
jgi:hypothetical protein